MKDFGTVSCAIREIEERLEYLKRKVSELPTLADFQPEIENREAYTQVISQLARRFGLTLEQIMSKTRKENVAQTRHICAWVIRTISPLSLESIGILFNGRDHGTIMHSCKCVSDRRTDDGGYRKITDEALENARASISQLQLPKNSATTLIAPKRALAMGRSIEMNY